MSDHQDPERIILPGDRYMLPPPAPLGAAQAKAEGARIPIDPFAHAEYLHRRLGPPTYRLLPW